MFKNTKIVGLFGLTACVFSAGIVAPALSQSQEYPTQVATHYSTTWVLKSCARKPNHVVSCNFLISGTEDKRYAINLSTESKLVDNEGNEYRASRAEALKRVVGANSSLEFNLVKDAQYKATIDFSDVPDSVRYATLLQLSAGVVGGYGVPQYRNVPFINLDGSISDVPLPARVPVNNQPVNTNNPNSGRRLCLPIVGCLKGITKN